MTPPPSALPSLPDGPVHVPAALLADERSARAAWSRLAEPADERVSGQLAEVGAVQALVQLGTGADPDFATHRARAATTDLVAMLAFAHRRGLRVVIPGDDDWPAGLDDLQSPPPCLWVLGPGDLAALRDASVAVVGSRCATHYGRSVATDLAVGLVERGYAVVSGAAHGIDRAAHEGALAAQGATVAVMAGGLDRFYPPANAALVGRIAEVGAVLSEIAPGGAPTKHRFLKRNRLIATMTRGTVVVEAGLRSGSLNTARTAAAHARPVGAVPGPVTSTTSAGCHQAIRDGYAELVTDAAEVLDLVGRIGVDAAPRRSAPVLPEDEIDGSDRLVLHVVPYRAGAGVDRIALHAALSVPETFAALGRLSLAGLVVQSAGRWRRPGSGTKSADAAEVDDPGPVRTGGRT